MVRLTACPEKAVLFFFFSSSSSFFSPYLLCLFLFLFSLRPPQSFFLFCGISSRNDRVAGSGSRRSPALLGFCASSVLGSSGCSHCHLVQFCSRRSIRPADLLSLFPVPRCWFPLLFFQKKLFQHSGGFPFLITLWVTTSQ